MDVGGGQSHASAALTRERADTRYIEGWVGPRAGLDGCGNTDSNGDSIPRTDQPVESTE